MASDVSVVYPNTQYKCADFQNEGFCFMANSNNTPGTYGLYKTIVIPDFCVVVVAEIRCKDTLQNKIIILFFV